MTNPTSAPETDAIIEAADVIKSLTSKIRTEQTKVVEGWITDLPTSLSPNVQMGFVLFGASILNVCDQIGDAAIEVAQIAAETAEGWKAE